MTKLLFIKASPRSAGSKSNALAEAYLDALKQRHSDLAIDILDLAKDQIPEFDGNKVAAKMAVLAGEGPTGAAKTAWDEITEVANRFIAADRYLIATPMWNGGIPYRLKQFIDVYFGGSEEELRAYLGADNHSTAEKPAEVDLDTSLL